MDPWYIERNRAIKRARTTRERLQIAPTGPVEDLLAAALADGMPVVLLDHDSAVFDGAYVISPGGCVALLNGTRPLVRMRFTLAHELGHHVMEHGTRFDEPDYLESQDLVERCASTFAAELLIPRDAAVAWCATDLPRPAAATLGDVVRLAAAFGVSAHAALIRLRTAKLLPDVERSARLSAEIADGLHLPLYAELDLPERRDGLADAALTLPWVAPELRGSRGALGLV